MAGIHNVLIGRTTKKPVNITNQSVSDSSSTATAATAVYEIDNAGIVQDQDGLTLETWLLSGAAADYDVRATHVSGTVPGGSALGSWLNCGVDNGWNVSNSAQDNSTVNSEIFVEIGYAGSGTAIDSATVHLSATSLSGV